MSVRTPAERGASVARRILLVAFGVGLLGALLAFAAGEEVDGPLGTAGAVLVLAALAVMFVVTPVGVWLSVRAMRERWRALAGVAAERRAGPGDRDRPV
jgi:hypothetical protein